jgi:nicotinamide riboside kinase
MVNNMFKIKVINLFGGAGVGKSTTASHLHYLMKKQGKKCDIANEYAKKLTYENNLDKINDQLYLLAKQHNQIHVVRNTLDYIIMDSPLLLSAIYDIYQSDTLRQHCIELHQRYDTLNFYIRRETEYDTVGRYHTEDESKVVDTKICNFLSENNIPFFEVGLDSGEEILQIINTYEEKAV